MYTTLLVIKRLVKKVTLHIFFSFLSFFQCSGFDDELQYVKEYHYGAYIVGNQGFRPMLTENSRSITDFASRIKLPTARFLRAFSKTTKYHSPRELKF